MGKYEITQLELSKRLGVGTTSVYNWCNGIKTPRMDKVDAMCEIFHCKRSDLMEDKSSTVSHNLIKVLGRVAAGIPIEAITDSMEPDIHDGDTVIVRKQDDADSDEIVIALVNGYDGVCKRLKKYSDSIALISLNPSYEPMYFSSKEVEEKPVRIVGKVVELRRKF